MNLLTTPLGTRQPQPQGLGTINKSVSASRFQRDTGRAPPAALARLAARLQAGWSARCVTCASHAPRSRDGKKAVDVVLVSGGAGFIGSHVIDGLLAGGTYRVRVLDDFVTGLRENLAYFLHQIDLAEGDLYELETVESAFAESR